MPQPTHHFFIDETGGHDLTFVDPNFPVFLLVGCLVGDQAMSKLDDEIRALKRDFFGSEDVILHSREIRKCEGAFHVLRDSYLKQRFYERLNAVLRAAPYRLLAIGLDKASCIEHWGLMGDDPYALCLTGLMSDLACCLESEEGGSTADIVIEMRGRNEDEKLRSHFNRIMDAGTGVIAAARFKARIVGYKPRPKRDNVNVLQVVDLCAYPLARHFIRPNEPYQPYDIIADKLYRRPGVEYHECGFKILS